MIRTTLTKSLHTVSAVSRLAVHLSAFRADNVPPHTAESAVRYALRTLGMQSDWPETDETFAKCVAAVTKARGVK